MGIAVREGPALGIPDEGVGGEAIQRTGMMAIGTQISGCVGGRHSFPRYRRGARCLYRRGGYMAM